MLLCLVFFWQIVQGLLTKSTLLSQFQLVHEVITEAVPSSSCTQNKTEAAGQLSDDHHVSQLQITDPILQRLMNLVDLLEQSKCHGYVSGEVVTTFKSAGD